MGTGQVGLRKIQTFVESVAGTAGTCTAILAGTLDMQNEQKIYRPDDLATGRLSHYERSHITGEIARLVYSAPASFEQLQYVFSTAIKTAVISGAGPYTWTFTPSMTAANAAKTYTIEYGDDVVVWRSSYCFATDWELSGSIDDVVRVKSNLVGQNTRIQSFTGSLSAPTLLNSIVAQTGILYVDSVGTFPATTQKAATLIDFNVKQVGGFKPVKFADGTLYFGDKVEAKRHLETELTLAVNSNTSADWWTPYIASPAQTVKKYRLTFPGPSGAYLHIDFLGVIENISPIQISQDGMNVYKIKLQSIDNGTSHYQVILINSVASLV